MSLLGLGVFEFEVTFVSLDRDFFKCGPRHYFDTTHVSTGVPSSYEEKDPLSPLLNVHSATNPYNSSSNFLTDSTPPPRPFAKVPPPSLNSATER